MNARRAAIGILCGISGVGAATALAAPVDFNELPGSPYSLEGGTTTFSTQDSDVVIAPLNGDARPDVASARFDQGIFKTLFAPADPLTSPFTVATLPNAFSNLEVADVDADGDQDIASQGDSSQVTFLNDATGNFTQVTNSIEGFEVVVAPFTADALPDAVGIGIGAAVRGSNAARASGDLVLTVGTADGRFAGAQSVIAPASGGFPRLLAAGDTDGDGDQDVISAGDNFVRIVRNDGGSSFVSDPPTAITGSPADLAAADLDEDGKSDSIILTKSGSVVVVRSSGGVTEVASGLDPSRDEGSLAVADLDGDANLDVVVGNAARDGLGSGVSRPLRVLTGDGAGGFATPQATALSFSELGAIAAGDLTGDGLADLAVSYASGGTVSLLRNTTPSPQPSATTTGASNVTATSATITGTANANGGANPTVAIEYGTTNALGSSTTPQPLSGSGSQPVDITVNGLQPGTTYFARVTVTTAAGTATGTTITFTTKAPAPLVTTLGFNDVTSTSANTLGRANPNGGANPTYVVEYGTTNALGSSTTPQSLASSDNGQFVNVVLQGLQPATTYFFRSRLTTSEGTATGAILSFTTPDDPAVALVVPYRGVLLSEAPFALAVTGPSQLVEWDFGERPATEADLADPTKDFQESGVTGASVVHSFPAVFGFTQGFPSASDQLLRGPGETVGVEPGVDGTVPPVAGPGEAELRRTYLVRARVTRPSGRRQVLASTVVVRPDTPPKPVVEPGGAKYTKPKPGAKFTKPAKYAKPAEYTKPVRFSSLSVDPDEFVDPNLDVGGRDQIIRERWNFGDGSPDLVREPPPRCPPSPVETFELCARSPSNVVAHNFFDGLRAGKAPLTDFNPGSSGVKRAAAVRRYAARLNADGPGATKGPRRVTLTVTDRSGRTRTRAFDVPLRRRQAPKPALLITGPTEATSAEGDQKLREPIIADQPGEPGTSVEFDLRDSAVDPDGRIAFHILEVGFPKPKPCPANAGADKCARKKAELTPPKGGFQPVVVSDDELARAGGKVKLTFPEPADQSNPLSVLDTAYDETGAAGATRYDGFVVEERGGKCKTIRGKEIGKTNLVFSGTCVDLNKDNNVFWTQEAVTLNGLRVRPAPGRWLVVRQCYGKVRSVAVEPKAKHACDKKVSPGMGELEVLAGGDPIVKLNVNAQPKLGGGKPSFEDAPTAGATYQGFKLKDTADLEFKNSTGKLTFNVDLPKLLAPPGGDNSGETVVEASDVPTEVVVKPFNGIGIGKVSTTRPRARAAAVPQPIIDAAATTIGGINIPGLEFKYDPPTDTFVGSADVDSFPLPLPVSGLRIRVVLRNGEFVEASGDVDGTVPLAGAINLTGFGFTIAPKGGGVVLQGRVRFGDASGSGLIEGTGAVTSELTSNFSVTIDGSAKVAKLLPVKAFLSFGGAGVGFGAGTGAQFGPARFNLNLSGAFSASGFQISGNGNACLFLCLDVNGLASERAVAGCGSIDLLLKTISAGFGVIFNPRDVNIFASCDLSPYGTHAARRVAGRAAEFTVPTRVLSESLAVTVPAAGLEIGSNVAKPTFGQTPQVQLVAPDGRTVAQSSPELGAFSTTGNVDVPGEAFHVFVDQDAEAGVTRFLVPEPATKGSYTVRPLPGSIAIAQPVYAYGDPKLSTVFTEKKLQDARQRDIDQVEDGDLYVSGGHASDPTLNHRLKAKKKFRTSAAASAAKGKPFPAAVLPAGSLGQLDKQVAVDPAAARFDPASGIGNTYLTPPVSNVQKTYAEVSIDPDLLTAEDLDDLVKFTFTGKLPPGQRVTFYETGPVTGRYLFSVRSPDSGLLGGSDLFVPTRNREKAILVDGILKPASKRHCIDAFVTNEVGVPRGTVRVLCFDDNPLPIEKPETQFEVDLAGLLANVKKGRREVVVNPIGVDRLGGQGFAMIEITKGDFSMSQQLSSNWIAGQQAAAQSKNKRGATNKAGASAGPSNKRLFNLARSISRKPVRKRSFAFRLGGLPRGPEPISVKVAGLPVPGQPGKVDVATGTLRRGKTKLTLKLG